MVFLDQTLYFRKFKHQCNSQNSYVAVSSHNKMPLSLHSSNLNHTDRVILLPLRSASLKHKNPQRRKIKSCVPGDVKIDLSI